MDLGCGLFKVSADGGCEFVLVVGLGLCRSLVLFCFFFEAALADVGLYRWWMWVCAGGGFGFVISLVVFFFFFLVEAMLADVYLCWWWMWACTGGGFGFVPHSLVVFFFFFKAPVVVVGVCAGGDRW